MPAYKDNVHNTWYCMFYFEDWTGQKKKKKKCGFKTKKEALEWENEFKLTANANMDMKLIDFIEIYFRDKSGELKERTIKNKRYMIENRIVPYFGERRVNEITPSDIIQWQTEMKKMEFSDSYLRMLQNQMTALFTHASKIYNLKNNPCKKVKKMGRSDSRSLTFWTLEEYETFLDSVERDSRYFVLFETLFWTGMRIGELLALTKEDVDLENNQINIDKTYYRSGGKDRGLGSIDFQATARSVLIVRRVKDDPTCRVIAHDKGSLAPEGQSIAFRLDKDNGFTWEGTIELTVEELLSGEPKITKLKAAIDFLTDFLSDGLRSCRGRWYQKTHTVYC